MKLFKRYGLKASVFITGATVLIVEILATRILSPYFGNTIYTISSVIGVVLTALSFGYYFGGSLVERNPSIRLFFLIIIFSGFSIFFMRLLMYLLLPIMAYRYSIISGPLISSVVLFFLPSFLLGLLSPYAVKLQQLRFPKVGVGKISGEIFFWSTLGSIGGSLGSGFFLIPRFGSDQIIIAAAGVLLFLGVIGLVVSGEKNKKLIFTIVISIGAFSLMLFFQENKNFLYFKDGVYEKIMIYDGLHNDRPTRFFQQDRSASGAMFLDSDELVYDYTKYYTLYQLAKESPKNILVLGGGAYSIPKAILKKLPQAKVEVVEIEPSLYDLAKKYFRLEESPRLKNYIEDGRRFLRYSSKKYDLIFSDVYYSFYSVPIHFTTKEFYSLAKKKLSPKGVFIANFIGDLKGGRQSLTLSEMKTFRSIFQNSYFFALTSPTSKKLQSFIFLGLNSNEKINFDDVKIKSQQDKIIRDLSNKLIYLSQRNLSAYPILTDNYAPIEYLTAQVLRRTYEKKSVFFDSKKALSYIKKQLDFGPRYLSSDGHKLVQAFLISELNELSDEVITQSWDHRSSNGDLYGLTNIIGRFSPQRKDRILLGTHYDTRRFADQDGMSPDDPVPGANDGASGVAIILEIAEVLSNTESYPKVGVDIVFFDAEEGEEDLSKTSWIPLGSSYFAKNIDKIYSKVKPINGVIVDMVCDRDLRIEKETASLNQAGNQFEKFWNIGYRISSYSFSSKPRYEIKDDHTALNEIGIPTFLIIDFDYPYFHTTKDTIDKCSEKSLKVIGDSILSYIYSL